MPSPDPELETLRAKVNCAAILEGWPSPWRLDVKESTTMRAFPDDVRSPRKSKDRLERLVAGLSGLPGVVFLSATDANLAGDRYAAKHEALAAQSGVPFERLRPPIEGGDWNDLLKQSRQRKAP